MPSDQNELDNKHICIRFHRIFGFIDFNEYRYALNAFSWFFCAINSDVKVKFYKIEFHKNYSKSSQRKEHKTYDLVLAAF